MSECVVRMEMPTSCEKCPACDYEEGNCLLADDRNTLPHNGKRRPWCPIICSLPEGHGRLVDTDELSKYWKCRIALMNACSGKRGILESVEASTLKSCIEDMDSAKTIVPAEERSET